MYQVLFHLPFTQGWFPPDGVPIYGFGAMLFLTFVVTAMWWGPRRVVQIGLPRERLQDMAILVFLFGIAGARILYMLQFPQQFAGQNLFVAFFQIWNGGIVFYGSVFGGLLGYYLFYKYVLKKFRVSGWKMVDAIAPLVALGMAIGRIGCYLNGCCWGQPVCEECQPVPLAASLGEFPLLPAHAREQVIKPATADDKRAEIRGLQTSTGFSLQPRDERLGDPRSVIAEVEPGSEAKAKGVQRNQRVTAVNGEPNRVVLELRGTRDAVNAAVEQFAKAGGVVLSRREVEDADKPTVVARLGYDDPAGAFRDRKLLTGNADIFTTVTDVLNLTITDWPKGRSELELSLDGKDPIKFTPRTVSFFPTQLYETVSMVLLVLLLLAFQPFRRHDGQVVVVLMIGYSLHRFLNEAIRIEPTYALGLSLSQWISVGIFAAAVLIEVYLRLTMPKLPPGAVPLSYGAPQPEAKAA